jgi:single-strand DNA-binding protein
MASFNKVILLGNLTRDPQLRYLPSQMAVCDFGLAVNRKFKTAQGEEREEVTFVDCTAFGKQAEVLNQYCQKGKGLFIDGRLKFDSWEDKQGGGKRSKLSVVIENFQFIGGPGGPGGGAGGGGGGAASGGDEYSQEAPTGGPARGATRGPAPQRGPAAQRPAPQQPYGEEQQFKEDDIPF